MNKTRRVKRDGQIVESRFVIISGLLILVTFGLLGRLWLLQIYRMDYYQEISERNRIRRFELPAPRGVIYDRNGQIVLGNAPFYDLAYVPQFSIDKEATFRSLSRLLNIPMAIMERRLHLGYGKPRYAPIILKRNLSIHEVSIVEANRIFLPGVEIRVVPRRDYKADIPPHVVGYLSEVSKNDLQKLSKEFPEKLYQVGDLIGKQGLEAEWEPYLRGKQGFQLIQVDARGRKTTALLPEENWSLPYVKASKGANLELTLDMDLQRSVKSAFKGKYGAVIVMDPRDGSVLAMLSEPGFDPSIYQSALSQEEWHSLVANPFKPLFDKATGGEYIPGSVYKALVAIAGLEEEGFDQNATVDCPGYYTLGNEVFQCWKKGGHGLVNLRDALVHSCDVFFYELGVKLGADRIADFASRFGLGQKLGIRLNHERPGLVPTTSWKKKTHNTAWTAGDTPNIAIGQGYNLMTPLQLVSLYAGISNGGKIWRPRLVSRVTSHIGEVLFESKPELVREVEGVSPNTFDLVRQYLGEVVSDPKGSGHNAMVIGHTVAGKTGSAQVVSLKKNASNKNDDVSVNWKEHALFAAFSPVENAEVAIIIVSENDAIGGGGAQAAPIAQKILKAYWDLKEQKILKISGRKEGQSDEPAKVSATKTL